MQIKKQKQCVTETKTPYVARTCILGNNGLSAQVDTGSAASD